MNSAKIFREAFDILKKAESYAPKLNGDRRRMEKFFTGFLDKRDSIMSSYEGTDDEELAEDMLYAVTRRVIRLCGQGGNDNGHNDKNR